ncbi:MAG: APC family permease [Gammaproteobacteria bacterium]
MHTITGKPTKVLSVFSLVMINVIAVDSLRTLPISAEYGSAVIIFYAIATLAFLMPIALVAAELATTWPRTGGIYVWIREAFGENIGFWAIWLQWIYNVVWFPTIMVFMASTLAFLINPELTNHKVYLITATILLFWIATIFNCFGMRVASIVSTIGALVGTIIPMVFIVILGCCWVYAGKPAHITFSSAAMLPDFHHLSNLAFFVAVLFGLVGLEMSAVHAEEVRDPQRDYPRALFFSAIIIVLSLTLASLAIAIIVPRSELSLVSGLLDAFSIFFKTYNMAWMMPVMAILIFIGAICGVSAWIIGPTKGLLSAGRDGCLPPWLYRVNRHHAPVNLLIVQGVIFTILCSVFLLFPTINSSYWFLSALTAQLALIVYILMFAAAIKLRYKVTHAPRAYKIPGGKRIIWLVCGVGILSCLMGIILGFVPPDNLEIPNILIYELLLINGMLFFSVPPFILYAKRKAHWRELTVTNQAQFKRPEL